MRAIRVTSYQDVRPPHHTLTTTLPILLVGLQVAMSLDDLLEREGLGDDRLQAAISQAYKTFTTLQTLQPGRVERDLRQPKAAQDDGLSHQLQGGQSAPDSRPRR